MENATMLIKQNNKYVGIVTLNNLFYKWQKFH